MAFQSIAGFCSGSFNSRSKGAAAMRTVNMLIEKNAPGSKSEWTMFPRAGKELFATLPTLLADSGPAGPIKGAWASRSRVFVVAPRNDNPTAGYLFEIFEDGTSAASAINQPMAVDSSPVIIRSNGNQLMAVSGGNAYILTGTAIYQPIVSYARGYVSAFGTAITWTASPDGSISDKFDDVDVGDYMSFDNGTSVVTALVTAKADNEHLTIDTSIGGPAAWFYQAGTELLTASSLEFIDGYFIVSVPNSRQFRFSNLSNGKIWDELDVGEKLGTTDYISCVQEIGGQLALMGDTNSTEIWANTGDADNPFQRIEGRTLNCGVDAQYSVAKMADGSLCWLMCSTPGREMIVRSTGGEPVRISDHALENAMRGYSRIDDAIGCSFIENGHPCYTIEFPTVNRKWLYDGASGVWSEIGINTGTPEVYDADLARFTVHVKWPNGTRMRLGFDYTSGKVWEISPDYLDDDGTEFEVMRIAPHINPSMVPVPFPGFALDCELGTVDPAEVGGDGQPLIPKVSMEYSNDGARTWISAGDASLGRNGEYEGTFLSQAEIEDATPSSQTNPQNFESMPIWRGLGSAYIARTFKVKGSGKYLRAIYDGLVEVGQ